MKTYSTTEVFDEQKRSLIQKSSYYQSVISEEQEILKHKWIESEKLGYDIGFERALIDWIIKHKQQWLSRNRPSK